MNQFTKRKLLKQPLYGRSIEYVNNRISLYTAQKGKGAVTEEMHSHHKIPKSKGGKDEYQNSVLVTTITELLVD